MVPRRACEAGTGAAHRAFRGKASLP
jgi:hypothetical protein